VHTQHLKENIYYLFSVIAHYCIFTVYYDNICHLYLFWKVFFMESLGLSQKDAQSRNKWRRRIKGATG